MADNNRELIDVNLLNARIDALARDVAALNRDDPRRTKMVKEILRLGAISQALKDKRRDA